MHLVGSKRKLKKVENFTIVLQNHIIKSQSAVTYLGVQLDQHLSGDSIVNTIINYKSSFHLKFEICISIDNCKWISWAETRKLLCSALIQPYFDYCVASWYPSFSKSAKHRLQICQNKIIRFILQSGPRSHVVPAELRHIQMLDVILEYPNLFMPPT